MSYTDAIKRALATFIFGALSAPVASNWLDVGAWKLAVASGVAAVLNLVYRTSEAYLGKDK